MQKTILSGIQPSGQMSLGNYLGAIKRFVETQNEAFTYFFIADLHAITVRQDPAELQENCYSIAAWYLAAGLDPAQCSLFVQSQVPEHAQLGWVLGTFTQMGELERMTQFKDKAARHKQNINAGLFTYPSLMAADILLYQADEVPVGDDQKQHLELTRNVAERFNGVYGDVFTVPEFKAATAAARVMDLQTPTKKMSKSDPGAGTILLIDEPKQIEKKIKRAVTDTIEQVNWDREAQPGISNLIEIYAACKGIAPEEAAQEFAGQTQYGPLKTAVAEAVLEKVVPLQERYKTLMADKGELDKTLAAGAEKARETAAKTLKQVYEAVGFVTA